MRVSTRPMKFTTHASGLGRSNKCQDALSFDVNLVPGIQRWRPVAMIVLSLGRYGTDCLVWAQSESSSSHDGA